MPHVFNAELPSARRVDWDSLRVNRRSAGGEEPGLFSLVLLLFFPFSFLLASSVLPTLPAALHIPPSNARPLC